MKPNRSFVVHAVLAAALPFAPGFVRAVRRVALAVALLLAATPGRAVASTDHLECFKVKDTLSAKAVVDLASLYAEFPEVAGCQVKLRAREVCTPVVVDRVVGGPGNDAPTAPVSGPELTSDFLCYKVKCPVVPGLPATLAVTDPFGSRELSGLRTSTLCAPAPHDVAPEPCEDLVEDDVLSTWSAYGDNGAVTNLSVLTAASGAVAGDAALRAVTDAGFTWGLRHVLAGSPVDVSAEEELRFAIRGDNDTPFGWQGDFPVVILEDADGERGTWTPTSQLLGTDGVTWASIVVPLAGGSGWNRVDPGLDFSRVVAVEVQADTWDSGFTIDLDAMRFAASSDTCVVSCPADCSGHGTCDEGTYSCQCDLGWSGPLCDTCASDFVASGDDCVPPLDGAHTTWPNASSSVNGDAWLRVHHQEVTRLEPRVLVLNFANPSDAATVDTLVSRIFDGFAEGSRPRGYDDAGAPVHLAYQLAKPVVDLRDGHSGNPPAPPAWPYENSTLFPREDPPSGAWSFDYAELFGEAFAEHYGYEVPGSPGEYRTLCELVESGEIHELWVVGSADVPDVNAAEVLEHKQRYTPSGNRIEGSFDSCAGNGCFDGDVPACARSVRIGFVNYNRGPGCYLHSQGHMMESIGRGDALPALEEWWAPFAGFDLDTRHGLPFTSLYGLSCSGLGCASYPTPDTALFEHAMTPIEVDPWHPACGNVHFPPNARGHYDHVNTVGVRATCEDFGRHGGPGDDDALSTVSESTWSGYDSLAPDCSGSFLVWWFQNMPASGSAATFDDGRPMPSMWPFLFW